MRLYRIIIFLVIFQFMFVLPLHAGTIEGSVMCKDGKAISTTIKVVGETRTAKSDDNGYYSMSLRRGKYSVEIEGQQFTVKVYPYDTSRDFYVNCSE